MADDTKEWGALPPRVADVQVLVYGNRTWAMTENINPVLKGWPADVRRAMVEAAVREFRTALAEALLRPED